MADATIFAWTEPTPPEGYPAYVNLKRTDDGKCYITVRRRGNGGRDQGCIEVSPQVLESLQCDLCEWLYRDDVDRIMAAPEGEVDAELRRVGIDPAEAARQGKAALEGALETIRAHKAGLKVDAPTQINGKPWECAQCGKPILADLVWGETAGAFHAVCRRSPPFTPVVTVGVLASPAPLVQVEVVQCGPGMRRLDFANSDWWSDLPAGRYTLTVAPAGVPASRGETGGGNAA